jgi:anti-sigma-K factor RskA
MATDTNFGSAACMKYGLLLEDYVNGELAGADAKSVAEHLRDCSGCQDAVERAEASMRFLRAVEPSADPGPGFSHMVMARIRTTQRDGTAERAGFWQPFVSMGWRFAATAALALVALVTYDAGWGRHPQPNSTTARLMGVSDIFAPDPVKPPANRDEVLMMVADTTHGKD